MHGCMVSLLDDFPGIGGLFGLILVYAVAPFLQWRTTYLVMSGFVFTWLCCALPSLNHFVGLLVLIVWTKRMLLWKRLSIRTFREKKYINATSDFEPRSSSLLKTVKGMRFVKERETGGRRRSTLGECRRFGRKMVNWE